MSGLDEMILACPLCHKDKNLYEPPSYWEANTSKGCIWLISDEFASEYPQYGKNRIIFSKGHSKMSKEIFKMIQSFSCGWSSRKAHDLNISPGRHVYRVDSVVFAEFISSLFKNFEYKYVKTGGRYLG